MSAFPSACKLHVHVPLRLAACGRLRPAPRGAYMLLPAACCRGARPPYMYSCTCIGTAVQLYLRAVATGVDLGRRIYSVWHIGGYYVYTAEK